MATNGGSSASGSPHLPSTSLQAAATLNAGLQREPSRRTYRIVLYDGGEKSERLIGHTESSDGSLRQSTSSPNANRRRSTVLLNLQLNDPSVPGPGEMANERPGRHTQSPQNPSGPSPYADPNHHRAPSLGELHQELEAEQEGHVVSPI